jgi:hypothetical protein
MRHIGFAVSANCSLMGLAAAPAFEVANIALGQAVYALHFLSESGGAVLTSAGAKIQTEPFDDRTLDTLIVCGGLVVAPSTPVLIGFLQNAPSWRTITVLEPSRAGAEVRPNSNCPYLRETESPQDPFGRGIVESGSFKPAPIQPPLPHRDRTVPRQGD